MTRKDNLTKQYLHCLKSCFPIYGKQEKEYLKKIELHLEEYVSFHSDASYETLVSEFGSPTTLVSDYFTSLEDEYLFRKLQKKRYTRNIAILITAMVVSYSIFRSILLYKDYRRAQESHIAYETTIIEERED